MSSGVRRKGLKVAARATPRQNASSATRAPSRPLAAKPSTVTAAFIAPAEVPEMPSNSSQGSSSSRSITPQVKAPCAPPPCSARSTSSGSRRTAAVVEVVPCAIGARSPQRPGCRRRADSPLPVAAGRGGDGCIEEGSEARSSPGIREAARGGGGSGRHRPRRKWGGVARSRGWCGDPRHAPPSPVCADHPIGGHRTRARNRPARWSRFIPPA
jgi:hypothetical protein